MTEVKKQGRAPLMAKRMVLLATALLSCSRLCWADLKPYEQAVRNALRWYYRWKEPSRAVGKEIKCRGERFGVQYFVYCQPGRVNLWLEKTNGHSVSATFVGLTNLEYRQELEMVISTNRLKNGVGLQFTLRRSDVINESEYDNYYDSEKSKQFALKTQTHMGPFAKLVESREVETSFFLPLVREGDPFYHVYVAEAGRVTSIWEFLVTAGSVQEFARGIYDHAHKNVPIQADDALQDESRWYEIVRIDTEGNLSRFRPFRRYRPGDIPVPSRPREHR